MLSWAHLNLKQIGYAERMPLNACTLEWATSHPFKMYLKSYCTANLTNSFDKYKEMTKFQHISNGLYSTFDLSWTRNATAMCVCVLFIRDRLLSPFDKMTNKVTWWDSYMFYQWKLDKRSMAAVILLHQHKCTSQLWHGGFRFRSHYLFYCDYMHSMTCTMKNGYYIRKTCECAHVLHNSNEKKNKNRIV